MYKKYQSRKFISPIRIKFPKEIRNKLMVQEQGDGTINHS